MLWSDGLLVLEKGHSEKKSVKTQTTVVKNDVVERLEKQPLSFLLTKAAF